MTRPPSIRRTQDGRIETACPDCGQPLRIAVRDQRPDDDGLLFHRLVPEARPGT